VLSLRLAIFAGLIAVALWGLFSLLENLREPELLRSTKIVLVKGCDAIESEDARRLCPQLFCQKALLDARALPLKTTFAITVDRRDGGRQLVGGDAHANAATAQFACVLERNRVVNARMVGSSELAALTAQPGGWTLEQTSQ
jgi:hypothetical protein